jgi:hypothetical protein
MNKKLKEQLDSFILYCHTYPEQRFWQALRNWSEYAFIFGKKSLDDKGEDTFYKE